MLRPSISVRPPVLDVPVALKVLRPVLRFVGRLILEMLLRKESLGVIALLIAWSLAEEATTAQEFVVVAFVEVERLAWSVIVDICLLEFGSIVQSSPRPFLRESLLASSELPLVSLLVHENIRAMVSLPLSISSALKRVRRRFKMVTHQLQNQVSLSRHLPNHQQLA